MERKIIHFLYVPFTGLGNYSGFRGNRWLKNRIIVFKQFVIPSLLNQTNRNFVLWVSWRPEEKTNPQVIALKEYLNSLRGLYSVFTYGGVCFWDDKHKEDKLLERLQLTLPDLKEIVGQSEYVYMTIQPSDDLYLCESIERIQNIFDNLDYQAVGFGKGYIMNYCTKEIAEYNPTTNPPFFTHKFTKEQFLDADKHFKFTGPYESHEYVEDFVKYLKLDGRGFVVGTHGENISTTFDIPFKGRVLTEDERDSVLVKIGAFTTSPLEINKGWQRTIYSKLPYRVQRKLRYWREKFYANY